MFVGGEPGWANACVGNNGSPDYYEYSRGYSKAANILLDFVCEQGDMALCDELIYPICFNMRHSIELRVKHALILLDELVLSSSKGDTHKLRLDKTHDLRKLWDRFTVCARDFDGRLADCNKSIDGYIREVADIDSNGQVFRYPYGREDEKHLQDVGGVINLFNLRDNFKELECGLEDLRVLVKYLVEEYSCGTYTKYLSRYQIFSISKKLVDSSLWKEDCFKKNKEDIRVEFGISGRKLNRAIEEILNNYQFAPEVGVYPKLKGVSIETLKTTISQSIKYCPDVKIPLKQKKTDLISSLDLRDIDFDQEFKRKTELKKFCRSIATPELAAGISAIFNLYKDGFFSEYYAQRYNFELAGSIKMSNTQCAEDIYHYLSKSNYVEGVLFSLIILNRRELVAEILREFDLSGCFKFESRLCKEQLPDANSPYKLSL